MSCARAHCASDLVASLLFADAASKLLPLGDSFIHRGLVDAFLHGEVAGFDGDIVEQEEARDMVEGTLKLL
jgi:hypothetical protein